MAFHEVPSFERCVGKDVYTYCKEAYPDVQGRCKQSWNREKCIAAVDGFCRKAGQPPLTSAFRKENGLPDPVTFKKHVGKTPEVYIGEKYTGISRKRGIWNKERCTEAVAQFILLHGHYPQVQDCKKEHGCPGQTHSYGMSESRSEAITKKPIQNTVPQRAIGRGTNA